MKTLLHQWLTNQNITLETLTLAEHPCLVILYNAKNAAGQHHVT